MAFSYEGAFGQNPGSEAHGKLLEKVFLELNWIQSRPSVLGGSTFCAMASLFLMNKVDSLSEKDCDRLRSWCMNRQTTGFNGRTNKPFDSCYSFWIGSTLKVNLSSFLSIEIQSMIDRLIVFILLDFKFAEIHKLYGKHKLLIRDERQSYWRLRKVAIVYTGPTTHIHGHLCFIFDRLCGT